jgi:hypothetical protein
MEDLKVIIERRLLYDSGGNSGVQRIALVYVGTGNTAFTLHRVHRAIPFHGSLS